MNQGSSFFNRAFLLFAIVLIGFFSVAKLWKSPKVVEWDVTLYYSYLPATFIYNDLKFENRAPIWDEKLFFLNTDDAGNKYVKMTSGLAYLYAPFFFSAHAFALISDTYEADGFSEPYVFALLLSDLVFALLGLWFLGKLLLRWFSPIISFATLLMIFFGTNMAFYSYVSPMSHVYSFALVSMILFWSFKYFDNQQTKWALLLGLTIGLLVLIRPTNILVLLFPLTYFLLNHHSLNWKKLFTHLTILAALAFIICIPQLLYWKYMTGHYLVYSYNGETFFLTDPKIWKGLFSYRKGWFVYSPILVFGVLGIIPWFKLNSKLALSIIACLVPVIWITFSWWCWWYGGSFGARALIEYLPLMAILFAAFLQWSIKLKWWYKTPLYLCMGYLCYTSIFMSYQYHLGIIHFDAMSKELFWKQYLKPYYIQDYGLYLDPPDYQAAQKNE